MDARAVNSIEWTKLTVDVEWIATLTWTTIIETVSATGIALKPAIIFKGKDLQTQWFIDEFKTIADWYFICTENGWTDNEVAQRWLEDIYLPQTNSLLQNESDARLLILDGHNSHT